MKRRTIPIIILTLFPLSFTACEKIEEFQHGVAQTDGLKLEGGEHQVEEDVASHAEGEHPEGEHAEHTHKIIVTSPLAKDVVETKSYVCQIHSCRHIEICALEGGYLEAIPVKEGQTVQAGQLLFKILPTLYQAKLEAEVAEADLAQIEFNNTNKLYQEDIVSIQEVALAKAKLAKASANVKLTQAELDFANIKAPFDGIIDRLMEQQGSLIEEGDVLTTLSDNSVMWVYFNVPERAYLEYKTALDQDQNQDDLKIDLILANHEKFPQAGHIGAVEADFNNVTGNIAFRADFDNPTALLRHGQTGTVLIKHLVKNATVIPQRATFEVLAKRYAFVVGNDDVVHQREITIDSELDDIYVIGDGLNVNDKIILEGIRQVRDGEKVEYEVRAPEEVLANLKYKAE